MASWFHVQKSSIDSNSIGVFALRNFVAGELIALFYGHRYDNITKQNNEAVSKWALETRYGIYDPMRGLIGSGREAPYMAMHLVVVSQDDDTINAKISENFLVHATKDINVGDEISFTLHEKVWRPVTTITPSKETNDTNDNDTSNNPADSNNSVAPSKETNDNDTSNNPADSTKSVEI